jgi:hypothetical protein
MFERTQRWMEESRLFPPGKVDAADYGVAVSV